MALPPPVVQGGSRHRSAEALEEASEEAPRECGAGLTIGCRAALQARHMGPMATGGVAVQPLSQEDLDGGDRREHPVAPREITHLAARGEHRFGWPQGSPRRGAALKDGGDGWDHLATSCMAGYLIRQTYRRCVKIPTPIRTYEHRDFCLTSCHSGLGQLGVATCITVEPWPGGSVAHRSPREPTLKAHPPAYT
jgi:hypothetical protein